MFLISFIVPLYNQEKYIIPCLESIKNSGLLASTYEIFVWNDGSQDNSETLVKEYAKTRPNIKLVTQSNHGVSYSRNQALQQASGEYIWFVDSDDLVNSEVVSKILSKAIEDNLDMLAFNWKSLLPNGDFESGIHSLTDSPIHTGRNVYMHSMITMAPWAFLYKREFLLNNQLSFPEDYKTCEDIQFNQKALFLASRVKLSSLIGYIYRHMHESATKGHGNRVVKDQIRRLRDEIDWFTDKNDSAYLETIIYRNLREVNVWLAWADQEHNWFDEIKQALRVYKQPFRINSQTVFIWLMKYYPKEIFYAQRFMNRLRRKIQSICT